MYRSRFVEGGHARLPTPLPREPFDDTPPPFRSKNVSHPASSCLFDIFPYNQLFTAVLAVVGKIFRKSVFQAFLLGLIIGVT